MKAYYHARAREYDDWWLGRGPFADRDRPGWDEERTQLEAVVASLPACTRSTSPAAPASSRGTCAARSPGSTRATRCSRSPGSRRRYATFVQGDALDLPFEDDAFDRVFTSYFYCHLEEDDRIRFLSEARRVAAELVVVASIWREGAEPARHEERVLQDGSRWQVFKRVFRPEELVGELGGGEILHLGHYFLVVRSP